jgi:hypothetical protein
VQPAAFWDLTPNELKLCVEASNDQTMADRERDMWWAWHVAFLHRVDVKHFPKLSELMRGLRPKVVPKDEASRRKVGDELMAALLQLPVAAKPEPGSPEAAKPKDIVIFPDTVSKHPGKSLDASDAAEKSVPETSVPEVLPVPDQSAPDQSVSGQGAEQAAGAPPDRSLPPTRFSPSEPSFPAPPETPDEA